MVEIDGIQYISASDLREELGVSRQTLWRWRTEEKIPQGHRLRNTRVIFTLAEAEAIRKYALRVEPIEESDKNQLGLFEQSVQPNGRQKRSGTA